MNSMFTTRPGYLGVSLWAGAVSIHAWLETLCAARRPDLFLLPLLLTQALTTNIYTNTTKIQILTREQVPTQLNVLTYFYDYHSHHITRAVQDDKLREFFLSINKFKNNCKMANVFIHNFGVTSW